MDHATDLLHLHQTREVLLKFYSGAKREACYRSVTPHVLTHQIKLEVNMPTDHLSSRLFLLYDIATIILLQVSIACPRTRAVTLANKCI